MAQSVSRGTPKVEMEKRMNYRPICETRQVGIILVLLLCSQHCYSYLCCTLQLWGFPLANDIHHPLLKAPNRGAVSLEDCWKSGPLCWVCKVCNTGLGTGDWEFFFHLLNPTSLGEEPATNIIRWIFKRTKAPLRFFTLPIETMLNRKPIQHTQYVCKNTNPMCLVFQPNFFHKIISMIISHSFIFTYLSSKVLKTGCDFSTKVTTKAENTERKNICSGSLYQITFTT